MTSQIEYCVFILKIDLRAHLGSLKIVSLIQKFYMCTVIIVNSPRINHEFRPSRH